MSLTRILQDYLGQFWLHCEARKLQRKIIYHMGPTNSGKTYHAIQNLAQASRGCYLAPLRLLATELYDTLSDMGTKTTLLTGKKLLKTSIPLIIPRPLRWSSSTRALRCVLLTRFK